MLGEMRCGCVLHLFIMAPRKKPYKSINGHRNAKRCVLDGGVTTVEETIIMLWIDLELRLSKL